MKWHNGDPFTAEDVKFNFDRIFITDNPDGAEGTFRYNTFGQPVYGGTDVIDATTVRVNLTQPDPLAVVKFGYHQSAYMAHPASVRQHGNRAYSTDADKYVGTGPYRPVESVPEQFQLLVRFDDWWGDKPDFEELIFRLSPPTSKATTRV